MNRRTAERLGWQFVRSFTDNDKSAAKDGVVRDEFEQMLRVLRAGNLPDPIEGETLTVSEWHYGGSGHRHGEPFWAELARQRITTARRMAREREQSDPGCRRRDRALYGVLSLVWPDRGVTLVFACASTHDVHRFPMQPAQTELVPTRGHE
ncbi:hypothetical protein ACFQVD_13590 [Streptosporangium amethystogenes subsp. fukuiense]|uniref:Uncharacterized protein n=1 Tax=Streptosporangium amethystogenes subsp. fukuiense TaxID=698418 RepID=A0ABW2SY36_9ACTN